MCSNIQGNTDAAEAGIHQMIKAAHETDATVKSGAQVVLSNSWMTMLAAEMVCATEGVGRIIIAGQSVNDMTQMIAGMLAIGIVGLLLATGMRKLEGRCLVWNNQGR